jgi:hypothetical protein
MICSRNTGRGSRWKIHFWTINPWAISVVKSWISAGLVLVAIFGWPIFDAWRQKGLQKEYDRNPLHEAPDTDQLKWDLRHIREDINLLCHLAFIVVILLVVIACR